jgi:hypothetical protein
VFSFSQRKDDISQWRGYCLNVGGFCIEFDTKKLFSFLNIVDSWTGKPYYPYRRGKIYSKKILDQRKGQPCYFFKCSYDSDKNRALIKEHFDDIINKIELENESPIIGSAETLMKLNKLSTYVKDDSFKNERECRLVCNIGVKNVKYREGKSMVMPYIELDLSGCNGELPISKIIVGPTPHPELSKISIRSLLKSCGYKIEVESSKLPYRSW